MHRIFLYPYCLSLHNRLCLEFVTIALTLDDERSTAFIQKWSPLKEICFWVQCCYPRSHGYKSHSLSLSCLPLMSKNKIQLSLIIVKSTAIFLLTYFYIRGFKGFKLPGRLRAVLRWHLGPVPHLGICSHCCGDMAELPDPQDKPSLAVFALHSSFLTASERNICNRALL